MCHILEFLRSTEWSEGEHRHEIESESNSVRDRNWQARSNALWLLSPLLTISRSMEVYRVVLEAAVRARVNGVVIPEGCPWRLG